MRQVDFIIVGQGLAGTCCAYFLYKKNKSFVVIDKLNEQSASRVSSGILNPVTGRKFVKTWLIDELLPHSVEVYKEIETLLGKKYFFQKTIQKYFSNEEAAQYFNSRMSDDATHFVSKIEKEKLLHNQLKNFSEAVAISPAYYLDCRNLIADFSNFLQQYNLLLNEKFQHEQLEISSTQLQYKNITAQHIIFCEGYNVKENPWFKHVPIASNKGDFLLVKIPELPREDLINHGIFLVHWYDDVFWAGSNYQHTYATEQPEAAKQDELIEKLNNALNIPFEVIAHSCGIRPTIIGRRPAVGIHSVYKNLSILNGLGTKGVTLAPYFAAQLIENILHNMPIHEEARVERFRG